MVAIKTRVARSRINPDCQNDPPPLRVLTFLYSFAPGGVERIAARLHAAWAARGVDSRIVLADARIAAPMPLTAVTQIAAEPRSGTLARFVALLRGVPAIIAADRVDVLFCAGNTYTAPAVALRLLLGRTCPPILAKISNDLLRPDMPWLVRVFYRRWLRIQGRYIDHFVGMAPAMRGEIAHLIGVAQDRISIIEDPALSDADIARLARVRDGALRTRPGRHYLAIGRLAPQKNFALLLDAFARIAQPDDRLRILGEGPERAALEAQAARLGIADQVALPGHTDPLDIWLGAADAFVLSSDFEGVPAVVIEALAAGLPIIATDCCVSMADLLGHGTLGTLIPVGNVAALAAAMATIATAELEATMQARRAAAQRFTIEHATGKYVALLAMLAKTRAAQR
ncbi:glycosyl transferase [Sphingomonas psychrolutea]|uniref:Glycosyl transferase n=1 Tax=Sphingomonas psychrolutea TaxID=1259676 RepID=A0ABQ1H356_9SPHN|nr:glycosyl transferase [Sphingomonas psychrolutea]